MIFRFQFLSKITDFMTRLVRWPVDKIRHMEIFLGWVLCVCVVVVYVCEDFPEKTRALKPKIDRPMF